MKKRILFKINGFENENLKQIKKAENAISELENVIRAVNAMTEDYTSITEEAEVGTEHIYISQTIEVDELEVNLANIKILVEKMKNEIREIDKRIQTSICKIPEQ